MAEEYNSDEWAAIISNPRTLAVQQSIDREIKNDHGLMPKRDQYLAIGGGTLAVMGICVIPESPHAGAAIVITGFVCFVAGILDSLR